MAQRVRFVDCDETEFRKLAKCHTTKQLAAHYGVSVTSVFNKLKALDIQPYKLMSNKRQYLMDRWAMYNKFLNKLRAMFGRPLVPPENNPYGVRWDA